MGKLKCTYLLSLKAMFFEQNAYEIAIEQSDLNLEDDTAIRDLLKKYNI
ncbi:MAG: hypothetical protein LBR92_01285 [Puniceicoccales bacterium]|jgi:hypothetical protein|nr:hypothetical protein [Puniceicoccales bacterium]